jgi:tetratricopeptide (TPR) repeat protein
VPLPGGASDKLGNRYELRWIVVQLVELLTGRIEWLRIETPGEDAVEFRCRLPSGAQEAYQAKRGRAQAGRWTISALADVLLGFGDLLGREPALTCVFVSEHAAAELGELADRARASIDLIEFREKFLRAKHVETSWDELRALWDIDEEQAWSRLRRIRVVATSESYLIDTVDRTLGLLLDTTAIMGRAILTQLAIESVHRELTALDVVAYLGSHQVHVLPSGGDGGRAINTAPDVGGILRTAELNRIAQAIADGNSAVVVCGLSGMGKTTIAAQFARTWKEPVCWIDCELLATELEVLGYIGAYLSSALGRPALSDALGSGRHGTSVLAKLAGRELGALRCLVVWDGLDAEKAPLLGRLLALVSAADSSVKQLVSVQKRAALDGLTNAAWIHVERLSLSDERALLLAAFPEARVPDLEKAASITNGYPYLVHLLCGAAQTLDFHSAIEHFASDRVRIGGLIDAFLECIREEQRRWLVRLSWLGVPFSAADIDVMGGSAGDLYELASRHFVLRYGVNSYRVHGLLADLIAKSVAPEQRQELHEWSATFLRNLKAPTWMQARALLMHATKASMEELAEDTARTLLNGAVAHGQWALAREAASAIVDHADISAPGATFHAHFILGKYARIAGDNEEALREYMAAEAQASNADALEISRYEQACAMVNLGRQGEAMAIYRELDQSALVATRVASLVALGMMLGRSGDIAAAEEKINTAIGIANDAGLVRAEADANQALGEILSGCERYDDAIKLLRKAHALRRRMDGGGVFDVYGWFHLMHRMAVVERHLGNAKELSAATRQMWRIACASANLEWEAESAFAMCDSSLEPHPSEIDVAVGRLIAAGRGPLLSAWQRFMAWSCAPGHLIGIQSQSRQYWIAWQLRRRPA